MNEGTQWRPPPRKAAGRYDRTDPLRPHGPTTAARTHYDCTDPLRPHGLFSQRGSGSFTGRGPRKCMIQGNVPSTEPRWHHGRDAASHLFNSSRNAQPAADCETKPDRPRQRDVLQSNWTTLFEKESVARGGGRSRMVRPRTTATEATKCGA